MFKISNLQHSVWRRLWRSCEAAPGMPSEHIERSEIYRLLLCKIQNLIGCRLWWSCRCGTRRGWSTLSRHREMRTQCSTKVPCRCWRRRRCTGRTKPVRHPAATHYFSFFIDGVWGCPLCNPTYADFFCHRPLGVPHTSISRRMAFSDAVPASVRHCVHPDSCTWPSRICPRKPDACPSQTNLQD